MFEVQAYMSLKNFGSSNLIMNNVKYIVAFIIGVLMLLLKDEFPKRKIRVKVEQQRFEKWFVSI